MRSVLLTLLLLAVASTALASQKWGASDQCAWGGKTCPGGSGGTISIPSSPAIPNGALIADYTDLSCSNATWDATLEAWETTLTVAQTTDPDDGGFCTWGAIEVLGSIDGFGGVGSSYTVTLEMMVPVGLDVESQTDAGIMKLMRFNTKNGAAENGGFIDVYEAHRRQDITNARWGLIKENDNVGWAWIAADEPARGVFHSYEWRVTLDNVSRANGGSARSDLYVNGALLGGMADDAVTLTGNNHYVEDFYFMTYYNGVAPEDQVRYFRNVEVTYTPVTPRTPNRIPASLPFAI